MAKEEARKAKEEIEQASSDEAVETNKEQGKEKINKVTVETKVKAQAKEEIYKALAEKEKEIKASAKLSEIEKQGVLAEAKAAANKAKEEIDKLETSQEVQLKVKEFIYTTFIPVQIEKGNSLSEKEIKDSLHLPKEVEIVNIENKDTSKLGKTTVKVTLKLADGKQITINVPVEVIEKSQNGEENRNKVEDKKTQWLNLNI